jgi:8-oxo-dGTP pyrophosphatase MutT (NUDIX family)
MSRLPHLYAAVYGFVFDEQGRLLLLRRQNTGYYDGGRVVPAGHVEDGEWPLDAIIHECREEIGITSIVSAQDCFAVLHRREGRQYVDYWFLIKNWQWQIVNWEPDKCSEIWRFALDDLPEVLTPTTRVLIAMYREKTIFADISL